MFSANHYGCVEPQCVGVARWNRVWQSGPERAVRACVRACMLARVRTCVRTCVRACARARVRAHMCVHMGSCLRGCLCALFSYWLRFSRARWTDL